MRQHLSEGLQGRPDWDGFACAIGRLVLTTEVIGCCLMGTLILIESRTHGCILADGRERTLSMALVTKLKEYRERDNFKQAELAELVGVRRETIVNLEKGKYNPSLKLAMDIAKGLSHHGGRIVCVYRRLKNAVQIMAGP